MRQSIISVVLALCLCIPSQSVAYAWQEDPSLQVDVLTEESTSGLVTRDSTIPTPAEVYEAMIALRMRIRRERPGPTMSLIQTHWDITVGMEEPLMGRISVPWAA